MINPEFIRYFLTYSSYLIIFCYALKKLTMVCTFVSSMYLLVSRYYYLLRWKEIEKNSKIIKEASSEEESLRLFEKYKQEMSLKNDKIDKNQLMERIIGFYPTKWNYFNFYMNFVFSFKKKIQVSLDGWEFFEYIVNELETKK